MLHDGRASLVGGPGSCPSVGQGHAQKTFKQLMLVDAAVFPLCWLFGRRHPSSGANRMLDVVNNSIWEGSC